MPRGDYKVIETDYDNYSLVYSCSSILWGLYTTEYGWLLTRDTEGVSESEIDRLEQVLFDATEYDTEQNWRKTAQTDAVCGERPE